MQLKVKFVSDKIGKEIPKPRYATDGAAGIDLPACIDEPITINRAKGLRCRWYCRCAAKC